MHYLWQWEISKIRDITEISTDMCSTGKKGTNMLSWKFIIFFIYRAKPKQQQLKQQQQLQQLQQQQLPQQLQQQQQLVENEESPECRIINLQLLRGHIEEVTKHVATCSACQRIAQSSDESFNALTMISEKGREGLASIIGCKFTGCGYELFFSTSTKTKGLTRNMFWTNNLAAVWGQMTTGGGFNTLEESLSVLNILVMTKRSFMHTEQIIGKLWWSILEGSMKAAGREERQIAINKQLYHRTE